MPRSPTGAGIKVQYDRGEWNDRPLASDIGQVGYFFFIDATSPTNPNTIWVTSLVAGVLTWVFVGGTGGGAFAGMKYFVNSSPPASPQPQCLYTSIAVAIAAAIADGHFSGQPAVISVFPGTYAENITLQPGISVQGMVSDWQDPRDGFGTAPHIIGTVDMGLSTAGSASLANVAVTGKITCGGSKACGLVLDHVAVIADATTTSPLEVTNASVLLNIIDSSFVSLAQATAPTISCTVAATITGQNVTVTTDTDRVAISGVGMLSTLRSSRIVGSLALDAGVLTLRDSTVGTSAATAALSNAAILQAYRCILTTGGGDTATGAGTLRTIDCTFPAGLTGQAAATTSATQYSNRQHTEFPFEGAGPYTVTTLFDTFLVDTASGGAANKTLNLPALNRVPIGTCIRFQKQISTANTVTLVRSGANTIGGIAADWVLAAGSLTGVTLQAGATDWRIVAN